MVSFYLDGGINMTGIRNYGNPLPNPDALQEFRVETSNFSAQYGRMSGAVVTAVTRSGTNQFHGSLFEFVRNTDLNAIPWNRDPLTGNSTLPITATSLAARSAARSSSDKAFFFFSYGGLRQAVGQLLSGGVVPTAARARGRLHRRSQGVTCPAPKTRRAGGWNQQFPELRNSYTRTAFPQPVGPDSGKHHQQVHSAAQQLRTTLRTASLPARPNQNEYLGKYDQVLVGKDQLRSVTST